MNATPTTTAFEGEAIRAKGLALEATASDTGHPDPVQVRALSDAELEAWWEKLEAAGEEH